MRLSPTGGNFYGAVKTFDANPDNTGNFVLIVENATVPYLM